MSHLPFEDKLPITDDWRDYQAVDWESVDQSQNLMIPMKLDSQNQMVGFFVVGNQELPKGGQQHLNDITGTLFKAELAGMKVIIAPVLPELQDKYVKSLIALADSIDRCDHSAHSQHTALWAQKIATYIQLSEEEVFNVRLAAKLHDIGKAVVSREILTKPGPLNESEWAVIKGHPGYGAALIGPSPALRPIQGMVQCHHEYFSGGGYPGGLAEKEVPLGARILSVADAFSTMTTGRAYRKPIIYQEALDELDRCSWTQFDPDLVAALIEIISRI